MTTTEVTEIAHLREKLREATKHINSLENASQKACNDATLYIKLLRDYDMDKDLKQRLILQFESLRLPLEVALKSATKNK